VVASGDWGNQSPPFLCVYLNFFDILVLLLMNAESFACKSWVLFSLADQSMSHDRHTSMHCGVKIEEPAVMYCHTIWKRKWNDEI